MATVNGNGRNNNLSGTASADVVYAGGGDDSASAAGGNDTVYGETGNDTLYGGTENDQVFGGDDTDSVYGDAGTDSVYGGAGDDQLFGGADADTLVGGSGNDTLFGGDGTDLADYSATTSGVTVNLSSGVATGGAGTDKLTGVENVTGTVGADSITGDGAANVLTGGEGNDSIVAGGGADTVYGGAGDDAINGEGDLLVNGGLESGQAAGTWRGTSVHGWQSATGQFETWGTGHQGVSTGDGGGYIELDHNSNSVDRIWQDVQTDAGESYSFSIDAMQRPSTTTNSFEVWWNGELVATVTPTTAWASYSYTVAGTGGTVRLEIRELSTEDNSLGVLLDNARLLTSSSDDVLDGGAGNDTILAGGGNDSVSGGDDNDSIEGGAGNDTLLGEGDDDLLRGDGGNDSLIGGAGADTLQGGEGSDQLYGGDGDDVLAGGGDADTLDGGLGNDTFQGGAGDVVAGGEDPGDGDVDVLDLSAYGFAGVQVNYDPLNPENGTVTFLDSNGDPTGTMTFTDVERVVRCFTPGTLIETDRGPRAVETLRAGDRVMTRDHGLQPVREILRRELTRGELVTRPEMRAVRIAAGALGRGVPARDITVSPQHRMLIEGSRAELLFGEPEVLVPAVHLVGQKGISRDCGVTGTTYIHLRFERHEIVRAEGVWSESFQPGAAFVGGQAAVQAELLALFPALRGPAVPVPAARRSLKSHESRALFAA